MNIRIATWNMAYWLHKRQHNDAWRCFMDETQADIYLFQEGKPTASMFRNKGHLAWNKIGKTRNWGSGIYSDKYSIIEARNGVKSSIFN